MSYTYSPESHLLIQKLYIYIYKSECNLYVIDPYKCASQQYAKDRGRAPLYLHGLKPMLSFTLSGKHINYAYTHAFILFFSKHIFSKHITVTDIMIHHEFI